MVVVVLLAHHRAAELTALPLHKDRPVGDAETAACSRELDPDSLARLVVRPKVC
jgi:hypothetical protein